jgi:large subunit ribosomal protein L28
MSRVCQVTKRGTRVGGTIARRGLPKYKGGIGLRTTGRNKRKFKVNVQRKRIWVPEIGQHVNLRVSTRALKTIAKNGAYPTLLKAGLIRPAGPKQG